ncbi:conjugative transposon protein TraN [Autumnicola musiva]|uniref:Conjugative transposon protein TraN n=1 Tax=Autumnicola musiva TaxID=3075589 RepID=A0ABU3D6C0_9FLAO|nr:conjugative transposon protein TraN [Zunongwangia sp. F117]MDT0677049.1 conjugative transposon protein TraN [Zunongwangia sp. F117]
MKKINALMVIGFLLFLFGLNVNAQSSTKLQPKSIAPYPLEITYFKTTNIIFPSAIVGVDRGSKDVLAQKAKGAANILQLKAARDSFPETNLTVITADGELNSFVINYTPKPSVLNVSMKERNSKNVIFPSPGSVNEADVTTYATHALYSQYKGRKIKHSKYGIRFGLNGIFIRDNLMYLRLTITNKSNISYDIDQLRFFIRDQKKAKRAASQEIEITPVHIQNEATKIAGQSSQTLVVAVPKFTIPDKKYFAIQIFEANGGRHLKLSVKNSTIIKASVFPTLESNVKYSH